VFDKNGKTALTRDAAFYPRNVGVVAGVWVVNVRKRQVPDDEGRPVGPTSILAAALMGIISVAVVYNSLWAHGKASRSQDLAGGSVRLDVDATNTIQLKYDPVVEEVQRQLLAGGYYKGPVDGVTGKRTRQAIQAYQQATGLTVTGEATSDLVEHIRYTRELAEASLFTGSIEPDPNAERRARIRRIQTGLAELAYNPGEITGEMSDQTRSAIKAFQHDRGLDETGEISNPLLTEMRKLSGQSELNSD
jgi:peptidoglycan hydrolase-like protein with peptidoglycan-binding domain